ALGACGGESPRANQPPVLGAPQAVTDEDTAVSFRVLDTARDPEGDPLTVTDASAPGHTVAVIAEASVKLTPAANFHGVIDVTYHVSDGTHVGEGHAMVTVRSVNDAPTAADATQQVHGPSVVMLSGNDVDGDALTYEIVTPPQHGTLGGTAPA